MSSLRSAQEQWRHIAFWGTGAVLGGGLVLIGLSLMLPVLPGQHWSGPVFLFTGLFLGGYPTLALVVGKSGPTWLNSRR